MCNSEPGAAPLPRHSGMPIILDMCPPDIAAHRLLPNPAMLNDHLFLFQDKRLLSPTLYCEHIASKAKVIPNVMLPPPTIRNANPMNGVAPPNQLAVLRTTFFCPAKVYVLYLQARCHRLPVHCPGDVQSQAATQGRIEGYAEVHRMTISMSGMPALVPRAHVACQHDT